MIPSPLLLAVVLPSIWIVDASNGPGTNFTDLPPAVAAASHGDTILVRPGAYSPFNVIGKALTIRGAGSANTFITSSPLVSTAIDLVPAGSCFYLSGLTIGPGPSASGSTNPALVVTGGSVATIADTVVAGQPNLGIQGTTALWVGPTSVAHAARCVFAGGTSSYLGGAGVTLFGGTLVADASSFVGGSTVGTFSPGGPGLATVLGYATIARSSLTGGSAFVNSFEAIRATQSSFVRFSGVPSDVIQGGTSMSAPTSSASAIVADATSSVVVHGAPSIVTGNPTAPPVIGPVVLGAPVLPYLSVAGTVSPGGELAALQPVTVTFEAYLPFAAFAAIVDVAPGFSTAFSAIALGELLVPVPSAFALVGTLDVAGTAQVSMTPAVSAPALIGLPLHVQFAVFDAAAGNLRLSNEWIGIFKP